MVTRDEVEREIYRRYIEPAKKKKEQYAGVEFELPIVNMNKEAVDFTVIHRMVDAFASEFNFTEFNYDDEGFICSAREKETGDDLSFDCSYNTLEFSFGREYRLTAIEERFNRYYSFIRAYLKERGHNITGMGINPYYGYNDIVPVPNGRYRMLLHHLKSYEKYADQMLFHNIPYYGLIACSAQTHVDADEQKLPEMINTFNRLEPLKALLFSNSPGEDSLCIRDHLWRESMHGLNPHNVDCWNIEVGSTREIMAYIRSMSLYCTEREGKYINFPPTPIDEYFRKDVVEGEFFNGRGYEKIRWEPKLSDLEYLRSFKFVDLTFRGTLELRSACMQPVSEAFTVPAFHMGLAGQIEELQEILQDVSIYSQGYTPAELRKLFVKKKLPDFAERDELTDVLKKIVGLSEEGLIRRGFGEERLLKPLKRRASEMLSPGREMTAGMEAGETLEYYIEKFGTLEETE